MDEKKIEFTYIKSGITELIDECEDIELLYLIRGLLSKEKREGGN